MSKFEFKQATELACSPEEQAFIDKYVEDELAKLGKTAKELPDDHFMSIIDGAFEAAAKKFQ